MSDLGDFHRLLEKWGVENEVKGVWSGTKYYKMLDLPDPGQPHEGRSYGVEFLFDPITLEFVSMTMYHQPAEQS
jgi:hypothetical protein